MDRRSFMLTASAATAAHTPAFAAVLKTRALASGNTPQGRFSSAKRFLFLDPALIERSSGVALRVNPPQRRETVILPDMPWEQMEIGLYLTIQQQAGKLRLWYTCRDSQNALNLAYAESGDGILWTKPNLGIATYNGSKDNNLLGVSALEGVVFQDPNAPSEKQFGYLSNVGTDGGLVRFFSPDGLHWSRDPLPLLRFTADSQTVTFWDDRLKQYVLYLRAWDRDHQQRKIVRLAVDSLDRPFSVAPSGQGPFPNNDPKHFPFLFDEIPTALQCDSDDPSGADVYNISAQPYLLDPTWYVGFPTFLRLEPSEVQFVGSRDGIAWHRYDRPPYVSPGADGVIPEEMAYMGTGVIARNGELWQYGTVFRTEHWDVEGRRRKTDGAIVRYVQREDGFVSADATSRGAFTTVPVTVRGPRLILNLDTGALGQVQVELLGADGKVLPGFALANCLPLQANSIWAPVTWSNTNGMDLTKLTGRQVRLVFHMDRARLYSFRFAD